MRNAMKLLKLFLCRKSFDGACAATVIISGGIRRSLFLATNKRWCKFKSASSWTRKPQLQWQNFDPQTNQSVAGRCFFFSQLLLTTELRRFPLSVILTNYLQQLHYVVLKKLLSQPNCKLKIQSVIKSWNTILCADKTRGL